MVYNDKFGCLVAKHTKLTFLFQEKGNKIYSEAKRVLFQVWLLKDPIYLDHFDNTGLPLEINCESSYYSKLTLKQGHFIKNNHYNLTVPNFTKNELSNFYSSYVGGSPEAFTQDFYIKYLSCHREYVIFIGKIS